MKVLEFVSQGAPLEQGHVVEFRNATLARPYDCQLGVIITADCDIAQEKHYGQLLLCPIVPIDDYFRNDWSRRRIAKIRSSILEKIRRQLSEIPQLAGTGELAAESVQLISRSEASCRAALEAVGGVKKGAIESIVKLVLQRAACESNESVPLAALVELACVRDSLNRAAALARIHAEFRADVKSDSHDIVATCHELPGGGAASVVLLRCPFSIPIEQIGLGLEELQIRRVGRYCDPVKYLVAQKFGNLFSRFGLPEHFETERDLAVDLENLSGDA